MNAAVLTLYDQTREQFELSRAALHSLLEQDVPDLRIYVVNNGSTFPETLHWLKGAPVPPERIIWRAKNQSPVALANEVLSDLFETWDHILCVPNDVVLPSNLYREFLRWPRGMVTGSMTGEREFPRFESAIAVSENTPMAVCLVRRWFHAALIAKDGYFFDPNYFLYASDCDLALRMAACGIRGVQLDIQYWHYGSASHRLANAPTAYGADADRDYFERKWKFKVDALEYGQKANDINFRGGQ